MKKIKCDCSGIFEEKTVEFEGFLVKAMKCNKCDEITFRPEQFKKVLALKELAKEINGKRKVVRIGNSIGIILPKAVEKIGIKTGKNVAVTLENRREIKIAAKS